MFQVQHYRKIQTAVGCRNVIAHNMREKVYDQEGNEIANDQTEGKWYNPEMAGFNRYSEDIKKPIDALKKRNDRINDANLKRKPQKNAAYAIEGVFSASPEFAAEWANSRKDRNTWNKYLDKTEQWIGDTFGKENVLHVALHMDETTPHLHMVMVPIVNRDGQNKYSSSTFLGGPNGLKKLHTEYNRSVGIQYGLERGIDGSRATHQSLREMKEKQATLDRINIPVDDRVSIYKAPKKGNFYERYFKKHTITDRNGKTYRADYREYMTHKELEIVTQIARDAINSDRISKGESRIDKGSMENYERMYNEIKNATPQELRAMANQKQKDIDQRKAWDLEDKRKAKAREAQRQRNRSKRNSLADDSGYGF